MNIDIEYIEKGDIVWVDKTLKYCIVVDIWLTMGNKYTICFEQAIFSIPNVFIKSAVKPIHRFSVDGM